MSASLVVYHIKTPLGWLRAGASEAGLSELLFADEEVQKDFKHAAHDPIITGHVAELFKLLELELGAYFNGDLKGFSIPLNPQGTSFQKRVWQQLHEIPFGRTISYQLQAEQFGNPLAIRAIAAANGKNPIAIIIPCHRVLGKDGSLTGYAGGIERKRWLLRHEGALIQNILPF
jgi:O-6-methylguanine DNA methyltransferase